MEGIQQARVYCAGGGTNKVIRHDHAAVSSADIDTVASVTAGTNPTPSNVEGHRDDLSYPRHHALGQRLLEWIRRNGGQADVEVVEVSPGHRILVTGKKLDPGAVAVFVPANLTLHAHSLQVQSLPFVHDMLQLDYRHAPLDDDGAEWAVTTFLMWASVPGNHGTARQPFDAYVTALPTSEDLERTCRWSARELSELQMQDPEETGMMMGPEETLRQPTAFSPRMMYDNDVDWGKWSKRARRVRAAAGWDTAGPDKRADLLQRWGVGEGKPAPEPKTLLPYYSLQTPVKSQTFSRTASGLLGQP
jgi:hypothetical protein